MEKTDKIISNYFTNQIRCLQKMEESNEKIEEIVNTIIKARDKENTIFTLGNGGSGSTASHFVSDLLKTSITLKKKRFKAVSLTDNIPVILAWANDKNFEHIFSEQLENNLRKGDIVIAFSGSGNSTNVINAIKYAKKNGAVSIGITGMKGGKLAKLCDIVFVVPSDDMLTIESMHLVLCHCFTQMIRSYGKPMFDYK